MELIVLSEIGQHSHWVIRGGCHFVLEIFVVGHVHRLMFIKQSIVQLHLQDHQIAIFVLGHFQFFQIGFGFCDLFMLIFYFFSNLIQKFLFHKMLRCSFKSRL